MSKVGPDYPFAIKQLASSFQAPGTRLQRKLSKRLHKLGALSLYSLSKQEPESSWMILTVLSERSLASFNLQDCSDQVLFHCITYMVYIGFPTTWMNLPGQWYRVCCKRSWCLKEVRNHPSSGACRFLYGLTGFRGTIKTWLRQAVISRKDFSSVSPSSLQCRSCCSPFVGQITGQPSQDDGRIRLGYTANMHMPNNSRTAS